MTFHVSNVRDKQNGAVVRARAYDTGLDIVDRQAVDLDLASVTLRLLAYLLVSSGPTEQ
jgi:hypothetical protein